MKPGRDAVDADAVARVVERHLPGQRVDGALRGAVGGVGGEADRRRDRADVDDRAAAAATMCGIAWREQVKMPQRFVSSTRSYSSRSVSVDRLQQADAGVVAEDVDTPVALESSRRRALGVLLVAHVGRRRTRPRAPLRRAMRASSSPSAASRCEATTAAPSAASRTAIARPIPRPAPVTIATLPSSSAARVWSLVISDDMLAAFDVEGGRLRSPMLARRLSGDLHAVRDDDDASISRRSGASCASRSSAARHGIVAFGLAGEVLKLSADERRDAHRRRSSRRPAAPFRSSSASARRAPAPRSSSRATRRRRARAASSCPRR